MKTYDSIMTPSDDGHWVLKSEADSEIRHHKYKRCLAMARMCEERSARYDVLQERHDLDWGREIELYYRWYIRWLKLADKFKEKKNAEY